MGKKDKGAKRLEEDRNSPRISSKLSRLDLSEDGGMDSPMAASSVAASAAEAEHEEATDAFVEALGDLVESAASKRNKALKAILLTLRSGLDLSDDLLKYREELSSGILWILHKEASEGECVLAVQVVCMFALVVGADDDEYLATFSDAFKRVTTRSGFENLRIWALTGLSFVSFICSSSTNFEAWRFCADVLCRRSEAEVPTPLLQAAAANAWVFLGTTMTDTTVMNQSKEGVFESLVQLLETPLTDVKVSGGEGIGFLWERAVGSNPDVLMASATDEIGQLICDNADVVENALLILNNTARESSKRVAKKDRKEQRQAFRELVDLIFRGDSPHETLRMGGATIEADTFGRIRILEMLRNVLIDGFHSSLRSFPVLRSILEVEHFTMDFMSGGGEDVKVDKSSSLDRQRTTARNQERRYREAQKEY